MAKTVDHDELTQLRAEIAMLRATVQQANDREHQNELQRTLAQEFLDWVGKTTQERTQMVADEKFKDLSGSLYEVQLLGIDGKVTEHPKVRLPAGSEYEAIGRYNQICGINGTDHKHSVILLGGAGPAVPVQGDSSLLQLS